MQREQIIVSSVFNTQEQQISLNLRSQQRTLGVKAIYIVQYPSLAFIRSFKNQNLESLLR